MADLDPDLLPLLAGGERPNMADLRQASTTATKQQRDKFQALFNQMQGPQDLSLPWIQRIVNDNKNKNFVQRILYPNKYPSFDFGDGNVGSHLMSWAGPNKEGKYMVYPELVYDPAHNRLDRLRGKQAVDHALRTGEFIEFRSPTEADLFSKMYKLANPAFGGTTDSFGTLMRREGR